MRDETDLIGALFADGGSTEEVASEFSGRGVGMGAVRAACEASGGCVEVESAPGVGTTMRFKLPRAGATETSLLRRGTVSVPPPLRSVSVPRMAVEAVG